MSEDDNPNPPRPPPPKVIRPPPPQIDPNRREVLDTLTETEFAYLLAKLKPLLMRINASMNPNIHSSGFPNSTQYPRRRRVPPPPSHSMDEEYYRNNPYFNPHIESVDMIERFFLGQYRNVNPTDFPFPNPNDVSGLDPLDLFKELLDLPKFRKFLDGLFGFVVKKMPPDWFEE